MRVLQFMKEIELIHKYGGHFQSQFNLVDVPSD